MEQEVVSLQQYGEKKMKKKKFFDPELSLEECEESEVFMSAFEYSDDEELEWDW